MLETNLHGLNWVFVRLGWAWVVAGYLTVASNASFTNDFPIWILL